MSPLRDEALIVGGIALAVLVVLWWLKNKVAAGAGAVNPVNPDNVFNSAVTGIVQRATGDKNQTLVGWFDDVFGVNQGLAPGEAIDPSTGAIIQKP